MKNDDIVGQAWKLDPSNYRLFGLEQVPQWHFLSHSAGPWPLPHTVANLSGWLPKPPFVPSPIKCTLAFIHLLPRWCVLLTYACFPAMCPLQVKGALMTPTLGDNSWMLMAQGTNAYGTRHKCLVWILSTVQLTILYFCKLYCSSTDLSSSLQQGIQFMYNMSLYLAIL